jgi:urea transport system permease protein
MIHRFLPAVLIIAVLAALAAPAAEAEAQHREWLVKAVLSEDAGEQIELVRKLIDANDSLVARALAAWRQSEMFGHQSADGTRTPILLDQQLDENGRAKAVRLADGGFLMDAGGKAIAFAASELAPAETSSKLRKAIKATLDLYAISNPNPKIRRDAVTKLGQEQNVEYLPHFEGRLGLEYDKEVRQALAEAVALTQLASDDPKVRVPAAGRLGTMRSITSLNFLQKLESDAKADPKRYDMETVGAAHAAVTRIEAYMWWGNLFGTAFRGLSLSAVLLVAALGLAITFGLMGVINMAHGEVMAVGAYTSYVVQGIFGAGLLFSPLGKSVSIKGLGLGGSALDSYFIIALVASFVVAALVGLVLERGVIRFLYKRPLESLLATWGVSLVLQQTFRHTFGAANVQVNSPSWLSGSFVTHDILFAYNRLFVIGFALFIVLATYLLLTRTSLGLQIRAVMQNRAMASCVGVRTDRVNMMTFAFGSGLAGMAGACMSQIANVGPSMGQSYIVDCFMIVVLGGVGNLVGTVSASLGVGVTNQILEPWLGAVLGKILVLAAIILFLQWRPAGLFVTRSRSLDS